MKIELPNNTLKFYKMMLFLKEYLTRWFKNNKLYLYVLQDDAAHES